MADKGGGIVSSEALRLFAQQAARWNQAVIEGTHSALVAEQEAALAREARLKAELAMLASEADERLMAWFDAEMVKAEFVEAGLAEKLSTLQERGTILKELEELLGIVSEHPDEVVEWKSFSCQPDAGTESAGKPGSAMRRDVFEAASFGKGDDGPGIDGVG